jgi:starch-binding outer membrane protein, SusD/RagB family
MTIKNKLTSGAALILIAGLALTYACDESFLEIPVTGQLDEALLSGRQGLESSLIAVYSQVNGRANRMASPSNWVWGSIRGAEANKGTDPGDFSTINPIQRYEALATLDVIRDKYNGNYEGVARANSTIRLLANAAEDVPEDFKTDIEAQTKFLRAHFYFELTRGYGRVPYVDESVDYGTGIELIKNDQDLWPMIEADMMFAYNNLPATQAQVGRVNKWAAAAYLAKIYMYQNKFNEAKALFDDIIVNGRTSNDKPYDLVPLYADVFKASNDNHEELVWGYQAAANTGSVNNANPEFDLNWPYNTGADGPGNCCSFFQPTFFLANAFRTSGGLPLLDESYNDPGNQLKTDMGLETADPFTPDTGPLDPRIDHSIGRRGIPYLDWPGVAELPGVFPGKAWIRNQPNAGPYQTKKFVYYQSDKGSLQDNSTWTPGYTAINFPIIRFADVLLMAAEAEIEVGDMEVARGYINRVRERAADPAGFVMNGGAPAANYDIELYTTPFGSQAEARTAVRFERKLELSGEGHRFYDLVRWGTADQELNAYLDYEAPKLPLGALTGAQFGPEDVLLPLPQGQIDLLGPDILKQNDGY